MLISTWSIIHQESTKKKKNGKKKEKKRKEKSTSNVLTFDRTNPHDKCTSQKQESGQYSTKYLGTSVLRAETAEN